MPLKFGLFSMTTGPARIRRARPASRAPPRPPASSRSGAASTSCCPILRRRPRRSGPAIASSIPSSRSPSWPRTRAGSDSARGSSSCPSAIRWSSRRNWPRSTSCRMAASSSASVWAISSRSSAPSAPRSRSAARVTDEYLAAIRAIWTEAAPAYRGRFAAFERVQAHPQPVQKPTPPIVIGGHSRRRSGAPFSRATDGTALRWTPPRRRRCLEGLREAAASVRRPPALPPLEISVSPRGRIDRAAAQAFAALGVHRLVLIPPRSADTAGLEQFVAGIGSDLVGQV